MSGAAGNPSGIVGSAAAGAIGIDAYGIGQNEFNQIQQSQALGNGAAVAANQTQAGTNSAIADFQPQITANNSALTQYFQLLGINTPTGGFGALSTAQNQVASLQNGLQAAQSSIATAQAALNNPGLRLSSDQRQAYQQMVDSGTVQVSSLQSQLNSAQSNLSAVSSGQNGGTNQASIQSQLANTPGYQFALNQGLLGAQQTSANTGLLNSGSAIRGAETYAEGLASQTYQQAVSNAATAYTNTNGGQAAVAQLQAGQGTNLANISNQLGTNVGNSFQQLSQANNPLVMQAASIAAGSGAAQAGIASSQNAQNTALGIAGLLGSGNQVQAGSGLLNGGFGGGV